MRSDDPNPSEHKFCRGSVRVACIRADSRTGGTCTAWTGSLRYDDSSLQGNVGKTRELSG